MRPIHANSTSEERRNASGPVSTAQPTDFTPDRMGNPGERLDVLLARWHLPSGQVTTAVWPRSWAVGPGRSEQAKGRSAARRARGPLAMFEPLC